MYVYRSNISNDIFINIYIMILKTHLFIKNISRFSQKEHLTKLL